LLRASNCCSTSWRCWAWLICRTTTIAAYFAYEDAPELYYNLGRAELLPTKLSTRIMSEQWSKGLCLPRDNVVTAADGSTYIITNADNRRLRLCATCDPRPRDAIVGYLRQDGAVTVHREGCHTLNATRGRPENIHQRLKLGWGDAQQREARMVTLYVDVYDRPGLLHEITQLMHEKDSNIAHICTSRQSRPGELTIEMILEVTSSRQLVRILHQIEALVNVKKVRCAPSPLEGDAEPQANTFYRPE
jgi:(p)ppGpp synthase/HD superfamily hydrolase